MDQLEQKVSKEEFYSGVLQERSPLRNAMASILKPIFEQVYKIKVSQINQDLKVAALANDQKRLSKSFYKLLLTQRVLFMSDEAKINLAGKDTKNSWLKNTLNAYLKLGLSSKKIDSTVIFKMHEGRLWAIDSVTNQTLAVTLESFNLKPTFLESLVVHTKKIFNPKQKVECSKLFV